MNKIFVVMCGIPGSGKSTQAKALKEAWIDEGATAEVISRDSIRFDLLGKDDAYFRYEKEVIKRYYKKLTDAIKDPWVDVIIADSTNVNRKARKVLMELAREADPSIHLIAAVLVDNPEECKRRNTKRTDRARVPDDVIDKMARQFEMPSVLEGFDEIWLVERKGESYDDLVDKRLALQSR